jgi:hypothetical protein
MKTITINYIKYSEQPFTAAAWYKARTVLNRSNSETVGSNAVDVQT